MCVRSAPVPCAKAQRSAKSMRRRTSSADQFASRSAITVMRAPMNVPSGFGARAQMWPLSMWVCTSTRRGSTMPSSRSKRGRPSLRPLTAHRSRRCAPSRSRCRRARGRRRRACSCAASATRHTGTRALARRKRVQGLRDGQEVGGHFAFYFVMAGLVPAIPLRHAGAMKRADQSRLDPRAVRAIQPRRRGAGRPHAVRLGPAWRVAGRQGAGGCRGAGGALLREHQGDPDRGRHDLRRRGALHRLRHRPRLFPGLWRGAQPLRVRAMPSPPRW